MAGSSWPALVAGAKAKASEVELKFDWIEGDIVPMAGGTKADNTYDLGESSFRWRDIRWGRQLLAPDGAVGTPSWSYASDPNTGGYWISGDRHALVAGGVVKLDIASTGLTTYHANGSAATPSVTFNSSTSTGAYLAGVNNYAISTNGNQALVISSAGEINKPLQPSFLAYASTVQSATSHPFTVVFDTEVFDLNSDYAANVFTAPVTGKYLLNARADVSVNTVTSFFLMDLVTSNRTYRGTYSFIDTGNTGLVHQVSISELVDMDAGDTASILIDKQGLLASGTTFITVQGPSNLRTSFSGSLIN